MTLTKMNDGEACGWGRCGDLALFMGGYSGALFSHGNWAGCSHIEKLTDRNRIIEASGILSKDGSYRDVHCTQLHICMYDRCIYTSVFQMYTLTINWFRKMIILPNQGTLCSCLKVDLSQVTKITSAVMSPVL